MICFLAGSMGGDFTIPWRLPNGTSADVSCGLKRWPGRDAMGWLGMRPRQVEFVLDFGENSGQLGEGKRRISEAPMGDGSLDPAQPSVLHRTANLWRRVGEGILRDGER